MTQGAQKIIICFKNLTFNLFIIAFASGMNSKEILIFLIVFFLMITSDRFAKFLKTISKL